MKNELDFYNDTHLKSYNLNERMRYQLKILDTLDAFTRKHSENVASITCRLCEYLHLNRTFTIYCTICAYLHDIGKIFVPQNILQKNGALTDEEYAIIKSHTTIGYKMCMDDPKLELYSAGPKYHHESLNGTGYPDGLEKKDIPLEGQIIRVADEFDAMISKRQYKTHIGVVDTLKMIADETKPTPNVNSKFGKVNPKIVKALFKVVIDDINFEIVSLYSYTKYLKSQIKRLEVLEKYNLKREATKNEHIKKNIELSMKMMFENNEDFDNFKSVLSDYRNAYQVRKERIDNLFSEIKAIKRLKV